MFGRTPILQICWALNVYRLNHHPRSPEPYLILWIIPNCKIFHIITLCMCQVVGLAASRRLDSFFLIKNDSRILLTRINQRGNTRRAVIKPHLRSSWGQSLWSQGRNCLVTRRFNKTKITYRSFWPIKYHPL